MQNKIILVDIFDHETGFEEKMAAHTKPLLHRAFSVFLYHGDKMLIQRRAMEKYHSGGLWANSCCSHPRQGEALSEAVERRLLEEVGVRCHTEEITSFVYYHKFSEQLYEYEYDHVFIGEYDGSVTPNPEEMSETEWIETGKLAEDLQKRPERYAPWFRTAAPMVLERLLKIQI